jgi:peptidoglycan biosynthesis protein MviN/MurJ (putative lipid II flippase)
MTPEQVTKRTGYMYATIGAGIACLFMAYQYTIQPTGRAEPPPEFAPYLFGGIGIVCFIIAAILWSTLKKEPTPAAKTDLSGPEGKKVIALMVIGFGALACTWLTDYVIPKNNGILNAAVSAVLLVIAIVCLFGAARIGKRIRQASAIAAAKE